MTIFTSHRGRQRIIDRETSDILESAKHHPTASFSSVHSSSGRTELGKGHGHHGHHRRHNVGLVFHPAHELAQKKKASLTKTGRSANRKTGLQPKKPMQTRIQPRRGAASHCSPRHGRRLRQLSVSSKPKEYKSEATGNLLSSTMSTVDVVPDKDLNFALWLTKNAASEAVDEGQLQLEDALYDQVTGMRLNELVVLGKREHALQMAADVTAPEAEEDRARLDDAIAELRGQQISSKTAVTELDRLHAELKLLKAAHVQKEAVRKAATSRVATYVRLEAAQHRLWACKHWLLEQSKTTEKPADAAADAVGGFIGLLLSMVFWKR